MKITTVICSLLACLVATVVAGQDTGRGNSGGPLDGDGGCGGQPIVYKQGRSNNETTTFIGGCHLEKLIEKVAGGVGGGEEPAADLLDTIVASNILLAQVELATSTLIDEVAGIAATHRSIVAGIAAGTAGNRTIGDHNRNIDRQVEDIEEQLARLELAIATLIDAEEGLPPMDPATRTALLEESTAIVLALDAAARQLAKRSAELKGAIIYRPD